MKSKRLIDMEQYILDRETASMEELAERFRVSMNTVRRDVAMLQAKGSIIKVYGGVRAKKLAMGLPSFEVRTDTLYEEKARIARKAAEYVREDDIIFLDSGTTTMHMIGALNNRPATVVTHNLEALNAAIPWDKIHMLVLPGALQRNTNSWTGAETVRALEGYHTRTAFMAATGLSMHGVTNSSPLEYEIKRAAIAQSERRILLIDHRKFGLTALMTYAHADAFDLVITDSMPPEEYVEALKNARTGLVIAQ